MDLDALRSKLGLEEMAGSLHVKDLEPSHVSRSAVKEIVVGNDRRADVSPTPGDVGKALKTTRADVTEAETKTASGFVADVSEGGADVGGASTGDITTKTVQSKGSVWDRLKPNVKEGTNSGKFDNKNSFASIVGSVPPPELEFFPVEKEGKLRVLIPKEVTKGMAEPFKSVLYGYFLGPRIPFPLVQRAVMNAWGKFGYKDAMMNEHGTFFFRFQTEGGCNQVVEASPLMIKGVPLFVYPWDPSKGLRKPEHTTCPLWIRFHNIPLVAFNREGISRIASAVGVPLRMDACTASTCDKAWGRTNFAKVLVNVWATGTLQREIEVVIPHLKDDGDDVVKVVLEYDWEPTQCTVCKVFGHKLSSCAKVIVVHEKETVKPKMDGDGFQQPRRKQWRPKKNNMQSKVIPGSTSHVDKGNEATDGDTMVGVGKVTRTIPKGGTKPTVQDGGKLNGEGLPNTPLVQNGGPNGTGLVQDGTSGDYCTLNAGRTPGAKDGISVAVEDGNLGTHVTASNNIGVHKPSRDAAKKDSVPPLVASVVQSFKQFERAKRGNPLPDTPVSNRYQALSSDDSEDEGVEEIDRGTVAVEEGEIDPNLSQ